ncbi:MAG: DUF4164 family protein [Pseudomonadota bacterium]
MTKLNQSLDRLNAALDALEKKVDEASVRMKASNDKTLAAELTRMRQDHAQLEQKLEGAKVREQRLAQRASEASEELNAAISEVRNILEG